MTAPQTALWTVQDGPVRHPDPRWADPQWAGVHPVPVGRIHVQLATREQQETVYRARVSTTTTTTALGRFLSLAPRVTRTARPGWSTVDMRPHGVWLHFVECPAGDVAVLRAAVARARAATGGAR